MKLAQQARGIFRRAVRGRVVAAIAGILALGAGVTVWWLGSWRAGDTYQLPPYMQVEDLVADLSAAFDRAAVVSEVRDAPVRVGRLEPGFNLDVHGRHRRAIVVPPPAAVRFRTRVVRGSRLRFSVGIQREVPRSPDGSPRGDLKTIRSPWAGIRFVVEVDGETVFTRILNPATNRHDRRWFDAHVDLGGDEREIEVVLRTEVEGSGRLAGTPGWSHVRVVRKTSHRRQPARRDRPNVLLLLVDTLRADRLGCYGAEPSPSPTLDRLARGGLLFQQVVAQAAWTLPSVASIMTGLHPQSHGVVGFSDRGRFRGESGANAPDPSYLSGQLATLADLAQDAGITTIGVSANPLVSRATNLAHGFETFVEFGYEKKGAPWQRADEINSIFLQWLQQNSGYRFLGYLHYMDIHGPYTPPDGYHPTVPDGVRPAVARGEIAALAREINEGKDVGLTSLEIGYLRTLYDAQIRYWDAQLAALLEAISAAGVRDSTVVVVASDHGEAFLEHGRLKHTTDLYDEIIRVPLIMHGSIIEPGRAAEQVQGIDLLPTIAGILELEVPASLPGQDLLGARRGRPAVSATNLAIAPDGATMPLVSLRTEEWKLIHAPRLARYELYDLKQDPAESQDRFGAVPEGGLLAAQLEQWSETVPPAPAVGGEDPGFKDKLRALGYID